MSTQRFEDVYPLSPMQQGMVFHSLLNPVSGVYVEQTSCTLRGDLDVAAFERAWAGVMERHPILRTGFVGEGLKELAQVVYPRLELPIERHDWRRLPPAERAERFEAYLQTTVARGFKLPRPPLFRLGLFQVADDEHRFAWTFHHALLDGWSVPMLLHEVFTYYEAFRRGQALELPRPRPYRDYIVWLRRQDMGAAEAFWRAYLAGFAAPTPLLFERGEDQAPADDPAPAQFQTCERTLDEAATAALQAFARGGGLTLNTLVQGAWALLLSRFSGEEDVLFGATVSGRPVDLDGAEQMVGLFINTLPVRVQVNPERPVAAWLADLQARQARLRQYEYTPLVQVQAWSEAPRGRPLFESLLVFENFPVAAALGAGADGLQVEAPRSAEQTNYPFTLVAGAADRLHLRAVFDARRVDAATAAALLARLERTLAAFAADPARPLGAVPLLDEAERRQLLVEWNATARPFPDDLAAHQVFEQVAARGPDLPAAQLGATALSYGELNRRANRLAHHLRRRGVGPETIVAICAERSPELLVAVLGVLKAGGAYLPLDPSYPVERLRFMLADAGASLLVTDGRVAGTVAALASAGPLAVVALDAGGAELAGEPDGDPAPHSGPDSLAYVIYTSGSTGQPKGALLQHRGLVNLATAYGAELGLGPGDRVLQFFAFGFDGSVLDIFGALLSGAASCLVPPALAVPGPELAAYLREQAVTVAMLPPAALAVLPADDLPALRAVLSGGEACTPALAARWSPGRAFYNAYGPTETTVAVTLHRVDGPAAGASVPIGRPLANTRLYVLDRGGQPVPAGAPGELYIGGVGVARGYLGRPELTAARFVPDPFSDRPGARLYRSGDLVRYRPDGSLVFLGRIDDQVKLRGFRIELGEIEAALRRLPGVAQAAVLAREDRPGERRLVAYLVPAGPPDQLSARAIREALAGTLPAYMLPAAVVTLAALPLTPGGKVDRRALPAPEAEGAGAAYVAPRTPDEQLVAELWAEVLGVGRVGADDDFFELGGHSLLAVRVAGLIEQRTGRRLPLLSLFQRRTVAGLAALLGEEAPAAGAGQALVPIQREGARPPLFFIHPSGGSVHWYLELAEQLGGDQPFYGLQARGVEGDAPLHTSVEAMGAYYAAAVRSAQPAGPYYLGSWSLGVVLALETARQLCAAGHEVALLAMLDQGPWPPGAEPGDSADYLYEVFGEHIPLALAELRPLAPADQVAHVLRAGQGIGWIDREVTPAQFAHFVAILRTHKLAWHRYTPRPYPGKVTLFRAEEQAEGAGGPRANGRGGGPLARLMAAIPRPRRARRGGAGPGDAMGWEQIALGGVEVIAVPGDHLSMLHKPHVRALAARLRECVDAALADGALTRGQR